MPKQSVKTPSQKIDELIAELDDWRRDTFSDVRKVFKDAAPGVVEEWKWMGTPTWYHDGLIAVANPHKGKVKVTFDQGAHLPDPNKLFNAGLDGNQRRAIDLFEGDKVNKRALKALVVAAISFNRDRAEKKAAPKAKTGHTKPPKK